MFDFLNMMGNYDSRKVARYEVDDIFVSTVKVTDSKKPYETAISHPSYNEGDIIVVEMYDTREEAEKGHERWVKSMTSDPLPAQLKDCSSSSIALFADALGGKDWRDNEQK